MVSLPFLCIHILFSKTGKRLKCCNQMVEVYTGHTSGYRWQGKIEAHCCRGLVVNS